MLIPCKEIAHTIEVELIDQVKILSEKGKKPKLLSILLGNSSEQLSFVKIKKRLADRLGIDFEFLHIQQETEGSFLEKLERKIADESITGVIIQHPFPEGFSEQKIYEVIPYEKEIEGHKPGSRFQFPLSLSVLTGLKYIFNNRLTDKTSIVNFSEDSEFFYKYLIDKKIVIVGRGVTGGRPIGKALEHLGIPFDVIHSQTEEVEAYYKNADIIITATGKKILSGDQVKPGVVLLNVGLRKENGILKGDYDEKEVEDIASYYTQTPGGLGPIDVLYLYKNLIDATKIQLS